MTDDIEQRATLINDGEAVRHADRAEVQTKQTLQEREGNIWRGSRGMGTGLLVASYTYH